MSHKQNFSKCAKSGKGKTRKGFQAHMKSCLKKKRK